MCSGQHPCENSRWRNGNGLSVRPLETPCCTILSNLIGGHSIVIGTRKEQRLSVSLSLFSYAFFISLFFFFSFPLPLLSWRLSFSLLAGKSLSTRTSLNPPQPSSWEVDRSTARRQTNIAGARRLLIWSWQCCGGAEPFACVPQTTVLLSTVVSLNQLQSRRYIFRLLFVLWTAAVSIATAPLWIHPAWISVS